MTNCVFKGELNGYSDNDGIGFVFRYKDKNNFYVFRWSRSGKGKRLWRRTGGKRSQLVHYSGDYTYPKWYSVEIHVHDGSLLLFLDDSLLFQVEDWENMIGGVGLYCWAQNGGRFRNLKISTASTCDAGEYKTGSGCASCGAGKYRGVNDDAATCLDCPAGKYSSATKAASCTSTCPKGYYCPTGSTDKTKCPEGSYGSTTGLSSATCR